MSLVLEKESRVVEGAAGTATEGARALRIAVIIVNYRTAGMVADCVGSLLPELRLGSVDHVFVVDNASGGDERERLAGLGGVAGVTVMESEKNLGFAGGNNLAIEAVRRMGAAGGKSGAEFYLLLNPDTVVQAGAVERLVRFLEEHPEAAFVGPRLEGADGVVQQSAFGNVSPLSELVRGASIGPVSRLLKRWAVYGEIFPEAHRAAWLAGACVLMRAEALERAGPLDEVFFMYYEEVDFFRRAGKLGLEAWYEPAARVVHLVGAASGVKVLPGQKRLPGYWFESRQRYFRKHFGYVGMVAADGFWVLGYAMDRLRRMVTGVSHGAAARRELRDLVRCSLRGMRRSFRRVEGKR